MFVVAIEPDRRAVVIGPRNELQGRMVAASEVNWLGPAPEPGDVLQARIRHRAPTVPATVTRSDGGLVEAAFSKPVSAITPGQSLVLYDGDRVVGGGVIERGSGARTELPVVAA
jgi:tRNA-specific 2-thiouridylase